MGFYFDTNSLTPSKGSGGGGGSAVIESLSITPATSAQTITAPTGTDGYNPVNVSAVTASIDANITAGNIKKDVQILGVTGSYEGSGGGGNSVDCMRVIDNNGNVALPSTDFTFTFPSTATAITGDYAFSTMFFRNNNHLTSIDASSITSVSGNYAFYQFCQSVGATSMKLASINFDNLTTVSGAYAFYYAFQSSYYLTSVSFPKLTTVSGADAFSIAFDSNSRLATINFPELTTVSGADAFAAAFRGCALTTVSFPKLEYIADEAFNQIFANNTYLQSAYFGGLKASTMGNVTYPFSSDSTNSYYYMFNGCSALTEIHFRADAKSKIQTLVGYADKWGASNATIYFDIAAAVITFDITPAVGNTIYLGGELVSGTTAYTDLENKTAVISNSSYPLVVKHYTNLQPEQVITTTVDLTQASTSNYIEIQPSESGCTVKFYIDGVEYSPTSVVGDNSRLTLDVDSSVSVGYKVTKSGYQDATGTVTFNNAIVTQSVTMQIATSRTVDLQYPFTTDKNYLRYLITDGSEGWYDGEYKIDSTYNAIIDSNYGVQHWSYEDIQNNGYITFTTGSQQSNLIINVYVEEYSNADCGIYISKTMAHRVGSDTSVFENDNWGGDGGHWLQTWNYTGTGGQAVDYTETLDANTTYYISFCYSTYADEGEKETEAVFRINRIRFDIEK